jgi:hypothetical protein
LQLSKFTSAIGCTWIGVVDDELHPRQADAVGGQAPPAEGGGSRIGEVEHDVAGLGLRDVVEMTSSVVVLGDALIDDRPPRRRRRKP